MAKQEQKAEQGFEYLCPGWDPEKGTCFFAAPNALDKSLREVCQDFLKHLKARYDLLLVSLRSVDPVHRKLIYLASQGAVITDLRKPVLDWSQNSNLSGIAAESRKVMFCKDISKSHKGRKYAHPWLVSSMGLKGMISIPVLNTCNINQILLILNLYPLADWTSRSREEFARLGDALAVRFEEFLKDRCVLYASRLSTEMARLKKRSPEHIYATVVRVLSQAVGASSIGIYIEKNGRQGVQLQSSIGKDFLGEHLSDIDKLANECWSSNREFLTISPPKAAVMYSGELLPPPIPNVLEKTSSSAFVPLRDLSGRARGVFCCLKGEGEDYGSDGLYPFTYEDIALIEAVGQAFAPQLEILTADIRIMESLNKLAHELRVPVVAFRAALERVQNECKNRRYSFQYDHFKDLSIYSDLMNRLLQRLDVLRTGPHLLPLTPERVHILSQIVPPAVRFVRPLLDKRGLDPKGITYLGLHKIPELYLDVGLMTTVVFNLLDNDIKYAKSDPQDFRIEIEGITTESSFEIIFRDWGVGVPEGWEEDIFEAGVRGPNAHEYDVTGQGLGLWFAREIMRRHSGDLILRKRADPTTFVIVFPENLRKEFPQDKPVER